MTRFMSRMADFLRSREGATAVLTAFAVFVLMGFAGMAVDIGIWQATKRAAQTATDAAALAGAHELNKIDNVPPLPADEALVRAAVETAAVQNGFDPLVDNIDVGFEVINNGNAARVQISKFAPLLFSRFFLPNRPQVGASATASRTSGNLELVLVVDVSGSMDGQKMTDMKAAALNMTDVIYGTETTIPRLWVGIVPFGSRVNVEGYGAGWLTNPPGAGQVCVNLRSAAHAGNDAPPAAEPFTNFNGPDLTRCPGAQPVLFLNDDRTVIDARLTALDVARGTASWRGAVWGWRMVSEQWQGLWDAAEPDLPNSYSSSVKKIVVVMTDGENRPDQVPDPWLGSPPAAADEYTVAEVDQILVDECNGMKAAGITVIAVTFQTPASVLPVYQQCATPGLAFDATNATELNSIFGKIGKLVKTVRLVK